VILQLEEHYIDATEEQFEITKQLVSEVTSEVAFFFLLCYLPVAIEICYLSVSLKSCWFDLILYVSVHLSHFIIFLLDRHFSWFAFKIFSFYTAMVSCVFVNYTRSACLGHIIHWL
jgi:hypothetical protein